MAAHFDPEWLAARRPFDEAALDREATAAIRRWAAEVPPERPIRVVDLGSGAGVALRRVAEWLADHDLQATAVDLDRSLLEQAAQAWLADGATAVHPAATTADGPPPTYTVFWRGRTVTVSPLVADVLGRLEAIGGPADGTVDLVLGHALADLLPLDRLAARLRALLRPGGLAHLALTYDGELAFRPAGDPKLDARVIEAYHRHMDRARLECPTYGGSTAGRRLAPALERAGLEVVRCAPSCWDVESETAADLVILARMLRSIADSLRELGDPPIEDVLRWVEWRRALLTSGRLCLHARHVDVLARRPD